MNKTLIFLLFTLLLSSCNKSPVLFDGLYLGMTKDEFNETIEKSENIYKSSYDKYDYNYKMMGYTYRFWVDFANDKLTRVVGIFVSDEWKRNDINNGVLTDYYNPNTNMNDQTANILSILNKKYGKYEKTVMQENEFSQYLLFKWNKMGYEVNFKCGGPVELYYILDAETRDKFYEEEKKKKNKL